MVQLLVSGGKGTMFRIILQIIVVIQKISLLYSILQMNIP